jgi:hypothetical protein
MRPECLKRLIGLQIAIIVAILILLLAAFLFTDFKKKNRTDDVVSDPFYNNWNVGNNNSIETNYSAVISTGGSKGIDYADIIYNINSTQNITQGQEVEEEQVEVITAVNDSDIIKTIDQQQLERTKDETEENNVQGQEDEEEEQEDGISAVNDNDIVKTIDQQQLGRTEEEVEENNHSGVIGGIVKKEQEYGIIVKNSDEINKNDTIVLEVDVEVDVDVDAEIEIEMELTANDNVVISNDSLLKEEFLPSSYSRGMILGDKAAERASDLHQNKQPIPEYFTQRKKPGRSSTALTSSPSSLSSSSQFLPSPSNRTEVSVDDRNYSISNVPSDGPSLNPSSVPTRSPSSMPFDFPSLSPSDGPTLNPSTVKNISKKISNKPSDGPSLNPFSVPTRNPSSSMPSDFPSLSSNTPSDDPSLNPSATPTGAPINVEPKIINPNAIRVSSIKNNSNKQTTQSRSDASGTITCPNDSPIGKGCNGFEENLNCGYNFFYTGCTFDVLACVPSVTCKCLPGGDWSCDGIFEQPCWGKDSDPAIVQGECDPNVYLPTSGGTSPTSTHLPTTGVSTFAPTATTGPISFSPSNSLSPTSTFIPTQTDEPTSLVPTETALQCPITYEPDAVCSASISNRECHYDYVYMGCSWNYITCGPTVECSCESPYGEDNGIWSCVEKKYSRCGLRRPANLPPLGESCDPDDDVSSTKYSESAPPSASKSASPSASPSVSPSYSLTTSPSDSPTTSPIDSPTSSPSLSPTTTPSDSATSSPSQSPATSPSDPPSDPPLRPSTSLETILAIVPPSTECPLSLQFGSCTEFQENLQCSYNHIYYGCTWDALTCLPSVICDCQQGNWHCTGDFMKPCEIDQGISPDEGLPWGKECDPNEVASPEIIVSISPSITPPTDFPTLVPSVVPTPRNYDNRLIKECPDTFKLGSCGNEYVDDLECEYNYIHIGCTWEDLTCSPSVSCRCNHWHGYWECISEFANCYSDNPLPIPDGLPWGETCDPEKAMTLPTR